MDTFIHAAWRNRLRAQCVLASSSQNKVTRQIFRIFIAAPQHCKNILIFSCCMPSTSRYAEAEFNEGNNTITDYCTFLVRLCTDGGIEMQRPK